MLSIGILFSETALAPGSTMMERIWPFFLALLALVVIIALFLALRGNDAPSEPPSSSHDQDDNPH